MKGLRWLSAWLLAAVLLASLHTLAQAHASPVHTVPEANAVLPASPPQVQITFSQAIDLQFSSIQVLDTSGARVDAGDVSLDPTDGARLTVTLRALPDGVYTVLWTALSTTDGHQTRGSFPFAVGEGQDEALASIPQVSGTASVSTAEVIVKGLLYLAAAALTGGLLFTQRVWQPALAQAGISAARVQAFDYLARRLAAGALLVFLAGALISLPVQAGQASGQALLPPWDPRVASVLFGSRFGALALARLGLVCAAAGGLLSPAGRWNRRVGLLACLLLGLTFSLQSHATEIHPALLPVLVDWLHLTCVSVWTGGLYLFFAGLWSLRGLPPEERTGLAAALIPRFSSLAMISVAGLALSGTYSAVLQVGSFDALFNTTYGRALVVKLGLFLPLLGLGAANLLLTSPRLRQSAGRPGGNPALVARLGRLVTGEAVLGSLVLVWAGLLTALPPAQVQSAPVEFRQTRGADDLQVTLSIVPARVGVNTFTAEISAQGRPVMDAREVDLEFSSASGRVPFSKAQMAATGPGTYTLKGSYLGFADAWDIQVVTLRPNQFDAYAAFRLDLNPNASAAPVLPWHLLDALLLLAAGAAFFLAYRAIFPRARRPVWGIVPAAGLVLAGLLVFVFQPAAQKADLKNPIPPSAASVSSGKALYEGNCAACHGAGGRGDGPVGLTLNPRPADLVYHSQPGVHTDGQLFAWISSGFPGSVMPAFSPQLSDKQIWDLVNFMRTVLYSYGKAAP